MSKIFSEKETWVLVLTAIFSYVVAPFILKAAWNWLMPQLFAGVGLLTWWKAFVICFVFNLMNGKLF